MKMRVVSIAMLVAAMGGCSGKYVFTVPDQIAPAGGKASAVMRLEQYEFASLRRSIQDAPVRLSVAGRPEMGAFTDVLGFAAASVPVPEMPGRYELKVQMQNADGDEASASAPLYVWNKNQVIVAIDADSLLELDAVPRMHDRAVATVRAAATAIADSAAIIYLTRKAPGDVHLVRASLAGWRLPDGPVLVWRQSYRHLARTGPLSVPKIVNEAHLVCDLSLIRRMFPGLKMGISASAEAVRAFAKAEITPIIVGDAQMDDLPAARRTTWFRIAADGLKR